MTRLAAQPGHRARAPSSGADGRYSTRQPPASIGSRLSLLAVQAGALEVTPVTAGDPAATEVAATIRATTHQALQELRSIVRVLRDDDEPNTAPSQPVAADLPALIAEASATASIHADWGGVELAEVPPDTGRTLYRIVQEGLTNARKHAPGSAVGVTVAGTPGQAGARQPGPARGRGAELTPELDDTALTTRR